MTTMLARVWSILSESLRWVWKHRLRLGVLVVVFALVAPRPVQTQLLDPCCALLAAGLSTIASTLSNVIGGGLKSILSVDQTLQDFQQNFVWPQQLIGQAQALVGQVQALYTEIQSLTQIPVNSATLPASEQLEQNLLSGDSTRISQTSADYIAVYGPVPDASAAPPDVRNRIDMTDAAAEAAMKRSIEIDQLTALELQAADQINQSLQTAAPGSAPIIEAQADAWLVRANAYTQAAMADLMRIRAIDLADAGADVKSGSTNTSNLGQQLIHLLRRQ